MAKLCYNVYAHIKGTIDNVPDIHVSNEDSRNLDALVMERLDLNTKLEGFGTCTDIVGCGYKVTSDEETAEFKKYPTGTNRYCTKCGAYLSDEEYENHTIKFCYYCGTPIKQEEEMEREEEDA